MTEYLPIQLSETEKMDIIDLAKANTSFYEVWKNKIEISQVILSELRNILYGPIPRNFVVNIKGNIGRQTGVFKTSFGCQLALTLDPTFNVEERMGFTPQQLLAKIKKYATRRQVFVLDERVRDFKLSGEQQLANIIESCRERQLCFVLIGVPEQAMTFSDYHFERLGESGDEYLTNEIDLNGDKVMTGKKTVYYLVRKITESRKLYRGYIRWNITPLTDRKWFTFWTGYMIDKREHQQKAIERTLTGFNFHQEAVHIMKSEDYDKCLDYDAKLIKGKLRNIIYMKYPDNTNSERKMIFDEVIYMHTKFLEKIESPKPKKDKTVKKKDDIDEFLDDKRNNNSSKDKDFDDNLSQS
jgi:hypothetical protein